MSNICRGDTKDISLCKKKEIPSVNKGEIQGYWDL